MTQTRSSTDLGHAVSRTVSRVGMRLDRVLTSERGKVEVNARLQALLRMRPFDALDRSMQEIVLGHAVACEKMGPGSLSRFIEILRQPGPIDAVQSHVLGRHATVNDAHAIVDGCSYVAAPFVKAMLREALALAGFGGRIIVEKTSASVPSVELVRGYSFELQPCFPVDFSFLRPRVACIDGFIESVSEVHHLLEAASAAKEPCVVFLRGASDDVINTLRVNYDRGSLRVIPMVVRFDLEGMNTLVDVAVVSGADVLSSLKGELISALSFDLLPTVDQITAFKGSTVIQESRTATAVATHANRLRLRRTEETVNDLAPLLDARIRSLSPNHVVIRLRADKDFVVNSQAIDRALRATKSCIERGVDETGGPVVSELAALHHARRCRQTLAQMGAALV